MLIEKFIKEIENEKNILMVRKTNAHMFCRPKFGNKNIRKIPLTITSDVSFLGGVIIGDGHLTKEGRFRITVEAVDKTLINFVMIKFNKTFNLNLKLKRRFDKRPNRQVRWRIEFDNKVIWSLFNKVLEIPCGKKSEKVKIPECVKENQECLRMFISGLFLADGGRKGKRISFTCMSSKLSLGIKESLNRFNIFPFTSKWIHNKSKKTIFDVIIGKRDDINRFKDTFPLVTLKLSRGTQVGQRGKTLVRVPSLGEFS